MAVVVRAADVGIDASTAMKAPQLPHGIALEAIDAIAPCYIDSTGGVRMSNGTAANAAAAFDGVSARAAAVGQPVTLFGIGTRFRLADEGAPMTPGTKLYVAATAGRFDTAATTGGTVAVARAINGTDARVIAFS